MWHVEKHGELDGCRWRGSGGFLGPAFGAAAFGTMNRSRQQMAQQKAEYQARIHR